MLLSDDLEFLEAKDFSLDSMLVMLPIFGLFLPMLFSKFLVFIKALLRGEFLSAAWAMTLLITGVGAVTLSISDILLLALVEDLAATTSVSSCIGAT